MSHTFKVGEIAIAYCPEKPLSPFNGAEVEVAALPQEAEYRSKLSGKWVEPMKYVVLYDGSYYQVSPPYLHKKPPPRELISTWDDVIVWRPREKVHG